jgi:hypothetical protein
VLFDRAYRILRRKVAASLLWDGLGFGGLAYFGGYLYLGIASAYYLAPVDLIAVLYVGRLAVLSWERAPVSVKLAALVLLGMVLFQQISLSAFRLLEQKNVIHAKAEIASVIKARHDSLGGEQRVFFPFASPYIVMEFASYLSYRGVPVEGAPGEASGQHCVVMVGRGVPTDGPCVGYRSITCHPGRSPEAGDLVIVLPDDDASIADLAPYKDRADLLYSYEPRPRIPKWWYPFVRRLHIASPLFALKELPDRWLYASASVWR